jgi:hypothetical protein
LVGTDAENVSEVEISPISDQMAKVRAAASSLLDKAENGASVTDLAAAVEKVAGVLKLAAEMDRGRSELAKLTQEISRLKYENETVLKRERSERIRDYVALLTPLITIITLAATLIAQNWQFLRSEKDKREQAIDAQWQDAVKAISTTGALSPAVVALQPFLRSPKYSEPAKDVVVNLLSTSSDNGFFTSLFGTALTPVTWDNVNRLVRLDRALYARGNPLWTKSWDASKSINDFGRLTKEELATYNYVDAAATVISAEISNVLKTPRPHGKSVDFSATYLRNTDFSAINFTGVDLRNTYFSAVDLKNAELAGLTQFSGALFYSTAWWEARSINRPLLEYLKTATTYTYKPGIKYGPRQEVVSQADYEAAVQRLMLQSK